MSDIKEVIRVLGFIQEYFDNHADEQEPNKRKELFVDWSDTVLEAITLLKAQEPRVMTIQEIKNADFCYLEVNGHDGVTPVLLKHFIDDKYIHVTINGGSVYFFDITCDVEKLVRCWTSRPTDQLREAAPW